MAKIGAVFYGRVSLFKAGEIVNNPPVQAGDVKVVKADGTVANITSLPAPLAADQDVVPYELSAAEMAGSAGQSVTVKWEDQTTPAAWEPVTLDIPLDAYRLADVPAAVATAVWDVLTSALTTAGSIGKLLVEKLALITSGDITVTGPVVEGGNVVTYRGDSYLDADGRALEWESASWPDLTTATIAVVIDRAVQFAGSVVTPAGLAVVQLELTAAQSATIPAKRHNFQVVATVAGKNYTLVEASWVSRSRAEV